MIVKTLYKNGTFKITDNVDSLQVNEPVQCDTMQELMQEVFGDNAGHENWMDPDVDDPVAYVIGMSQPTSNSNVAAGKIRTVACNTTSYICNDDGKTIEAIRPPVPGRGMSREEYQDRKRRTFGSSSKKKDK